jgi:hypothetical protein
MVIMAKKTRTRLKFKSPKLEFEYEGSELFLNANLTEQLEKFATLSTTTLNLQNKRELGDTIESLQLNLTSLESSLKNIVILMEEQSAQKEEIFKGITNFCEEISRDKSISDKLLEATRQMQEMNMSFNLQYLMLQNKISHENRQFTLVSNIMKSKHDTAKNSINNIR